MRMYSKVLLQNLLVSGVHKTWTKYLGILNQSDHHVSLRKLLKKLVIQHADNILMSVCMRDGPSESTP